jgi:hypothetical protein
MKLTACIRKIVLLTNPHWPFKILNKLPYRFAMIKFVQLCKRFPEIHAVYLRHSLVYENWEPGLSDVDLTVVMYDGQELLQEFHVLQSFWKDFRRLRKWLPMLADLNIMTSSQVEAWTGCTILGYEARDWKKIYGTECSRKSYTGSPAERFRDALNHAFVFYQWTLLPLFYNPVDKGFLARQRLLRVANKIIRYGTRYQTSDRVIPGFCDDSMYDTVMIACVLYNLDCCLKSYNFDDDGSPNVNSLFPSCHEAKKVLTNHQIENSLQEILPFILTIYRENGHDFVILKDDLTLSELEHSIRVIRNSAVDCLNSPVILTISMFKYILAYYSPDLYASLRWKREILLGKDSLYHLSEPSLDSFTRQLFAGLGNALNFAQGETFFTANGSNDDFMADLIRAITQLLKLRLYFDKGIIRIYKRQWYEELVKYYPDDFGTLAEIKERIDIHSMRGRLYCFEYLKHLSDDVCRLFFAYATPAKTESHQPSSGSKRG